MRCSPSQTATLKTLPKICPRQPGGSRLVVLPGQALVVDCANGVGAQKLAALAERLRSNNNSKAGLDLLRVELRNAGEAACR